MRRPWSRRRRSCRPRPPASALRGKLRLGVIETVVHSWLPHYMRRLAADYPQLEIDLTVDVSVVLQRRLMAGEPT